MKAKLIFFSILLALLASNVQVGARFWEGIPKSGLPGVGVRINDAKIRRVGTDVVVYLIWQSVNQNQISVIVDANPFEGNQNASIDGEPGYAFYMDKRDIPVPGGDEPVSLMGYIPRVPLNATTISSLNIVGRSFGAKIDKKANPYGKFVYRFTNLPIPAFNESNWPGCFFTDTDITLKMVSQEAVGKDLVFEFILTNEGKKDKSMYPENNGRTTVRNIEGEELNAFIDYPNSLPSGDSAKLKMTIRDGAGETFKTIKVPFSMSEPGMSYDSQIIIRPKY